MINKRNSLHWFKNMNGHFSIVMICSSKLTFSNETSTLENRDVCCQVFVDILRLIEVVAFIARQYIVQRQGDHFQSLFTTLQIYTLLKIKPSNEMKLPSSNKYPCIYTDSFRPPSRKFHFRMAFLVGWEARWPHGQYARLRSERSGFEPWPGTVCCVLGQDTLLLQCLSPPRCINGYLLFVGET